MGEFNDALTRGSVFTPAECVQKANEFKDGGNFEKAAEYYKYAFLRGCAQCEEFLAQGKTLEAAAVWEQTRDAYTEMRDMENTADREPEDFKTLAQQFQDMAEKMRPHMQDESHS